MATRRRRRGEESEEERRRRGAAVAPPPPPPPPPILPVGPGADSGAGLGFAVGAAAGGGTFAAGSSTAAILAMATTAGATKRTIERAVAAVGASLRRIAALRATRQRVALQNAGFDEDVINAALRREVELEAIYQRRAAERMRRALRLATAAPDASVRAAAVESATRRERNYARQRAIASGSRVFASVEQAALEAQSPSGAFWELGDAAKHTPDCVAMAGKFWPWEILRRIHPLLHVGCQCRLRSRGEATAAGLLTPATMLSLDAARAIAGPVITYVERHHAQENEALAELIVREELALLPGADLNFLAAAPLIADAEEPDDDDDDPDPEPEE